MKTPLKHIGLWKLLADSKGQKVLKRLKANLTSRLRGHVVGANCQPARRNIGRPLANISIDWIKRIVFLSLTTFALVEVPIAVADKKSEKETEGETVKVDDDDPCPGGIAIAWESSDGKSGIHCIGKGGDGGFPDEWRDLGKFPLDPCKLVPGACGGSRPDGDGKPDDADVEEDTEPCGKNDTFGTYEDSEETDCGKASAVCETEGNKALDLCWDETESQYEMRCQAGFHADGGKSVPLPCIIFGKEILCAGEGLLEQVHADLFRDCLDGYYGSSFFLALREGHCNTISTTEEAYCQNQAAEQCRKECLDDRTSKLGQAGDRLRDNLTGVVSGVDIVSEANMTQMNDSERALLQNLKDRTELGASVLHAMAMELFKSGYEELGVRIFEQYSILYPDNPKSSNRVPEGYRSRKVRESSENASELEGKLRRQ
ncbi:MAG: hypothetical protein AAGI44_13505 [Pseudomonadota bacterium]